MYKKVYAILFLLFCSFSQLALHAQDSTGELRTVDNSSAQHIEMADKLRADGKIYVVVTVVVIILAGLLLYVVRLDRKISKLEKETKRG